MDIYEQIYQTLRISGEPAWAGSGYPRAWQKLNETLHSLESAGFLPGTDGSVLELGCGNGAMACQWFAHRGHEVTGIDISATAIHWAQERFAEQGVAGRFQQGNICSLGSLQNERFDLIFDGSCLHCLIGEERSQAYSEIKRLLSVEGCFVLSSMCGEPGYEEHRQQYDADQHLLYKEGQPWRTLMPLALLEQEVLRQGFIIQHTRISHNPWWDHATLCLTLS